MEIITFGIFPTLVPLFPLLFHPYSRPHIVIIFLLSRRHYHLKAFPLAGPGKLPAAGRQPGDDGGNKRIATFAAALKVPKNNYKSRLILTVPWKNRGPVAPGAILRRRGVLPAENDRRAAGVGIGSRGRPCRRRTIPWPGPPVPSLSTPFHSIPLHSNQFSSIPLNSIPFPSTADPLPSLFREDPALSPRGGTFADTESNYA